MKLGIDEILLICRPFAACTFPDAVPDLALRQAQGEVSP
jgi:hypothetical protein